MSTRRFALLVACLASVLFCAACALFVSFDGFDTRPEDGTSVGDGGLEGFHLEGMLTEALTRDQPLSFEIRAVRDVGFVDAITFDAPSSSSTSVTVQPTPASAADRFTGSLLGSAPGTARVTIRAHSSSRVQSIDVDVSVGPGSGDLDPSFGDGGLVQTQESVAGVFGLTADDGGLVIGSERDLRDGGREQFLRKLATNGQVNAAFGVAGESVVHDDTELLDGIFLARANDGSLFVAGERSTGGGASGPVVHKFLESGVRDPVFGGGTFVKTIISEAKVVTDDHAVFLLGLSATLLENMGERLLPSGLRDNAYADAGLLDLGPGNGTDRQARCGRMVGPKLFVGLLGARVEELRLADAGKPDLAFGDAGDYVSMTAPADFICTVSPVGAAIFAGPSGATIIAADGKESSFSLDFFQGMIPDAVEVDLAGRILVAGAHAGSVAVVRYLPDGTPDKSFRSGGLAFGVVLPYASASAFSYLATRPDGTVILATAVDTPKGILVAQLLP